MQRHAWPLVFASRVSRSPSLAPGPPLTLIEAWKARQRVVVRVNTTVSPGEPRSLTPEEEQELRRRTKRTGGQAWEGQALLSADLELAQLEWRPLE